jgi:hypothetical protein
MDIYANILTIEWRIEDIIEAMREKGIEPTEENLLRFLKSGNIRRLEETSIASGWDVIYSIMESQRENFNNPKEI